MHTRTRTHAHTHNRTHAHQNVCVAKQQKITRPSLVHIKFATCAHEFYSVSAKTQIVKRGRSSHRTVYVCHKASRKTSQDAADNARSDCKCARTHTHTRTHAPKHAHTHGCTHCTTRTLSKKRQTTFHSFVSIARVSLSKKRTCAQHLWHSTAMGNEKSRIYRHE